MVGSASRQEYRLSSEVTLNDVDREVWLSLTTLSCEFERHEAAEVVTYVIRQDLSELGRLIIVPPTRVFPYVRVREVHTGSNFQALGQLIRRDLDSLNRIAKQIGVQESPRFSYPRSKRRQIVEEYRRARGQGEAENKQTWAERHYHISRKTLWRYECEFPEQDLSLSAGRTSDD